MRASHAHSDIAKAPAKPLVRVAVLVLWLASLATAISVVFTTFESRRAIQELEELRQEAIGLKVSSGQYQLERSALASYPRVETLAIKKLKMTAPESAKTVLVVRE